MNANKIQSAPFWVNECEDVERTMDIIAETTEDRQYFEIKEENAEP